MKKAGYKVVLNFKDFYGVEVEKREINGIMEDVMVLPMRLNGFYTSKRRGNKGIFLYGKAMPTIVNQFNQSHYLVSIPTQSLQKELKELGYKPIVYFGNLSILFEAESKSRPASNSVKLDKVLDQDY